MTRTKMHELGDFGQSLWLDYISRPLLETGKLRNLIGQGLRGMTSNPTIFNQAISQSQDYDEKIIKLKESGKSAFEIYDDLTIADVQEAADQFLPVYKATNNLDGYVSLEINPQLAHQIKEQAEEGKRLFKKVARPNVMIKVPSTPAGLPVVEELLSEGIPVNVTLIFSPQQYTNTVEAFLKGMERLANNKGDLSKVRSVASVFVSRIDTMVDKLLDEKKRENLKGKAAVANSRVILEEFKTRFSSARFKDLEQKGAHEQRVLWASTGTKNPQYSDLKYVTELIAQPTVNTMPEKTMLAFLDHGVVKEALKASAQEAQDVFKALASGGIDMKQVYAKLLSEGVVAFEKSFEELLVAIEEKSNRLSHSGK